MEAQILTPDGSVFDDEVIGFQAPGSKGSFEIKLNHANLTSTLDVGRVRARHVNEQEEFFAVSGGFLEVIDNKISVIAEAAEKAQEIDVDRARQAKERAEDRFGEKDMDQDRAYKAWLRAENRLKIAASGR